MLFKTGNAISLFLLVDRFRGFAEDFFEKRQMATCAFCKDFHENA
jgi:hypothetical protein